MLWRRLFTDPIDWQLVAVAVIPTAVLAFVASRLARAAMQRLLQGVLRGTVVSASPLVRAPLRLISITVFGIVFGALIFPAFEIVGLQPRAGMHLRTLSTWTFDSGLKIVLIGA